MFGNISLMQQTLVQDGLNGRRSAETLRRNYMQTFWNLMFTANWQRLRGKLTGRRTDLLDLSEVINGKPIQARRYAGNRLVPISDIRGSEGRNSDFDAEFRPLKGHDQERWAGVATAIALGVTMPPVDLVQVGDSYYVRDGHHRISIAAHNGQEEVDAQVTVWEI